MSTATLAFLQNIGTMEWLLIMTILLLLFGRRLPEVGRSLGKGIVEFKKGLKGVDEEVEQQVNRASAPPPPAQAWTQSPAQLGAPPAAGVGVGQPNTVGRADAQ